MTTAGDFRIAATHAPRELRREISIAGVPWPAHKVAALVLGVLVALVIGVATVTAATAVLAGAAVGTLAWVIGGVLSPPTAG